MSPVRVLSGPEELSRAVAAAFAESARRFVSECDRFTLVLAGGSTPRRLYEVLAERYRETIPWSRVHFFWGDERYVEPDHPDSNYRLVKETLLSQIDVPSENVHPVPTDLDDPEQAARNYESEILRFLDVQDSRFDWVLLGLGEDGHTASLFPGLPVLDVTDRWVAAVRNSPKRPWVRLTMTLPAINRAREVHFLVSGRAKAVALRSTLQGPWDPRRFPAQAVRPISGSITWWVDEAAAGDLHGIYDRVTPNG